MRLKRHIIDGEVFYKEIKDDNNIIDVETNEIVDENEEDNQNKTKEDSSKKKDKGSFAEKLDKVIKNAVNSATDSINKFSSQFESQSSKKAKKLAEIIPFLDDDELLHDLVLKIIDGDEEIIKKLDLKSILPFLPDEDCDLLFLKSLELKGKISSDCLPFVSEACLSRFIDNYIKGQYQNIDINQVYPFLSNDDIKRLFLYELNKKN